MDFVVKSGANPTRVFYGTDPSAPLPGDSRSFSGSPLTDLYDMFDTPLLINFGSDDTFIKSLDSIRFWTTTSIAPTTASGLMNTGITIVERGSNDTNFLVRAITGLDGMGTPNAETPWITISGSDPFGSGVRNLNHGLYDSMTNNGIGPFTQSSSQNRNQQIGGILIPFADFDLSIGDTIFGYDISVISATNRAGLDLLPGAAAFVESGETGFALSDSTSAVPEQPFANTMMALCFGGLLMFWRNRKLQAI